jgi:cob(I)alamin adenosyltransferase
MLTPEDIKNLTEFQKTVFVTKDDLKGLEDKVDKVQTSLDVVIKEKTTNDQERKVANRRIKELENWVDKAAPKLDIKFEH